MCECLKRPDGTWHVDECCASIMDEYHSGTGWVAERVAARAQLTNALAEQAQAHETELQQWRDAVTAAGEENRELRAERDGIHRLLVSADDIFKGIRSYTGGTAWGNYFYRYIDWCRCFGALSACPAPGEAVGCKTCGDARFVRASIGDGGFGFAAPCPDCRPAPAPVSHGLYALREVYMAALNLQNCCHGPAGCPACIDWLRFALSRLREIQKEGNREA